MGFNIPISNDNQIRRKINVRLEIKSQSLDWDTCFRCFGLHAYNFHRFCWRCLHYLSADCSYYLPPPPLNLYFFSVDFCSCYYKICNMLYECSKVLSLDRHVDYMCAIENLRKDSVYTN